MQISSTSYRNVFLALKRMVLKFSVLQLCSHLSYICLFHLVHQVESNHELHSGLGNIGKCFTVGGGSGIGARVWVEHD